MHFLPLWACAAALLLTACSSESVVASYCDLVLAPAAIAVSVDIPAPVVNTHLDRREVSAVLFGSEQPPSRRAMGLTRAGLQHEAAIRLSTVSLPGLACARPHAKVRVALVEPQVYVASEFPEGSCRYGEVLLHEMRHVQIYEDVVRRAAQDAEAALNEEFSKGVWRDRSVALLQERATRYVEETLSPRISAALAHAKPLQSALDSEQEYLRLSLACEHEPLDAETRP